MLYGEILGLARTMAAAGANDVARLVDLLEFGAPSHGDCSLQRAAGHIWTSSKVRTQFDASGRSKSQQKSSLDKDSSQSTPDEEREERTATSGSALALYHGNHGTALTTLRVGSLGVSAVPMINCSKALRLAEALCKEEGSSSRARLWHHLVWGLH